jgi:cytoskeleton protein RodZ
MKATKLFTAGHGFQPNRSTVEADEKSLGAILRAAREVRAITIREVAGQMGVPPTYLTMLEIGDYSGIADELYLLPYLRAYARFLGLDASVLSARFTDSIEGAGSFEDKPIVPLNKAPRARWQWSGSSVTIAIILFVAVAIYLVSSSGH